MSGGGAAARVRGTERALPVRHHHLRRAAQRMGCWRGRAGRDGRQRGRGRAARPRPGGDDRGRCLARRGPWYRGGECAHGRAADGRRRRADGGRGAAALDPEFQAALARRGVTDLDRSRSTRGRPATSAEAEESERRLARAWRSWSRAGRQRVGAPGRRGHRAGRPEHASRCCGSRTTASCRCRPRAATSTSRPARRCATTSRRSRSPSPRARASPSRAAWCAGRAGSCTSASRRARGSCSTSVGYEDGGRLRSILHRASLSEMVVPYGDPSPTHYFKNAFDAGENGVGVAASPLTRGCDCLGEIVYFDAVVNDAAGAPVAIPNAICMHEEDYGVLWRHIEWRDGSRRGAALAAAGDLVVLGDRQLRLRLLLVPLPGRHDRVRGEADRRPLDRRGGARRAARSTARWSRPGLNAMVHQHFFNMRLDLDVDGRANAVEEVWTESLPPGPGQPARERLPAAPPAAARRELEARRQHRPAPRRAGGRSSTRPCATGWASRSATG